MTEKQKNAFYELTEEIKNMPQEEFEREVLCLNGSINEEQFNYRINKVYENKSIIGGNDIWDFPNGIEGDSLTYEEFAELYYYVEAFTNKYYPDSIIDITRMFYEIAIYFIYNNIHYVWNRIDGQGSIMTIYLDEKEEYKKYEKLVVPIYVDKEIRFYKRIN
jgi:hypothetical protein